MEPPTTTPQQQLGRRQIETRKRRRASLPRRMAKLPTTCTMSTRNMMVLPAFLAVIAIATSVAGTTASSSSMSLLSVVVSAFAPTCHIPPRVKPSIPLGSLGATLAPKPAPDIANDEDSDGHDAKQQQRTSSGRQVGVEVWDAVFSPEVCRELHELAMDHSERTTGEEDGEEDDDDDSLDGSSIFVHRGRNRSDVDQLTPIEQALDSFLDAYYDHGEDDAIGEIVVEYWCRQEHLNLEAHADVDEVWFERSCKRRMNDANGFRYPSIGHVLYLTKPTLGIGPTCVFPPKVVRSSDDDANQQNDNNGSVLITDEIESVVTIPAVPGRVLRFPGSALHAVPKPANVWFSQNDGLGDNEDHDNEDEDEHDEEEEKENDYEIDGKWDDDEDDEEWDEEDDDDEERSVILFNIWEASDDDDQSDSDSDVDREIPIGPIGVHFDPMFHVDSDIDIVDMMMSSVDMDGVEVDEDFVKGMVDYARQQKNQQLKNWREKYCYPETERYQTSLTDAETKSEAETGAEAETDEPVVYSKVNCQPKNSWKLAPIDTSTTRMATEPEGHAIGDTGTIRVPLMGDKIRRRYPKKAVLWNVPSSFEKGVKEPEMPSEFPLAVLRNVARPND